MVAASDFTAGITLVKPNGDGPCVCKTFGGHKDLKSTIVKTFYVDGMLISLDNTGRCRLWSSK